MARLDKWIHDRRIDLKLTEQECADSMGIDLEEWRDLEEEGGLGITTAGRASPLRQKLAETLWVDVKVLVALGELYRINLEYSEFDIRIAQLPPKSLTRLLETAPDDIRAAAAHFQYEMTEGRWQRFLDRLEAESDGEDNG